MELYRAKKIGDIRPLEVFDISKLTEALRFFSSRNRMGKVAISLENDQSIIQVRRLTPRRRSQQLTHRPPRSNPQSLQPNSRQKRHIL